MIADIGCGQGRPTRTLRRRLPLARVLAVDASPTMLTQARALLNPTPGPGVELLAADFHRLPLSSGVLDAATAVFCLYHSAHPERVVGEIARVLRPGGVAMLVSKSADSYRELDLLLAASGLDPGAPDRPSLYASASGEILADLAASALTVQTVLHDRHLFRFGSVAAVAEYLLTVPKFQIPARLPEDPAAVAAHLRCHRGDGSFTMTSTITYVLAWGAA
ncbi:class I SAM-dependent methyltransferase [Actinomadura harenae]|uniref:class I SAM-dependent methyltransferase n=1 Tax=Actinomadura harenae TaxID=2483351 RepID=UPI0013151975|nr:class I SAM-dependent methyltransferase [Actinomadura harenae]